MDDAVSVIAPEAADPSPQRRNRKLLFAALFVLVGVVAGKAVELLFSAIFAETQAGIDSRAQKKVAREGNAFTAQVAASSDYPEAAVLSRQLSDRDITKMSDAFEKPNGDAMDYVLSQGGAAAYYSDANAIGKNGVIGEEWLIRLVSDRSVPLVITDIKPVGVKCAPARAESLVVISSEGGGSNEGIFFDLARKPFTPRITGDEEENYGDSFFRHKTLELGNGQSSVGLRVGVSGGANDCQWKAFRVTYSDTTGTFRQDVTNGKKGFAVQGVDWERLKQVTEISIEGVKDCEVLKAGRWKC
ncbi:hypothetical protein ACWDZW_15365 [Streptomyces coeruleorubidus]